MFVENLKSPRSGEAVKNQFAVYCIDRDGDRVICFQSYETVIAVKKACSNTVKVSKRFYSRTTSKYLNVFLTDYCCSDIKEFVDDVECLV